MLSPTPLAPTISTLPPRLPLGIVGTDTDAGKTIVSTALAAYWAKYETAADVALFKPVQSGEGDIERYSEIFGDTIETANSIYLRDPLAPPIAAERQGVEIDLGVAWRDLQAIAQRRSRTIVEWLGGLGSPVTWELTVADLIRDWRMASLLVVPVRLGSISQVVACAALAREAKAEILGIVLNCVEPMDQETCDQFMPIGLIERLTYLPVLGCLPFVENIRDRDQLIAAAAQLNLEALQS
ncbi:MAG: ATP-dependent dethiobiotin synthetase BioD [Oscillatoriales cyanobacterium]|nr:MAG: ATP-dependent dethiobiotin synthetase BioD [Oscillatoriales cyanobacterium]